MVSLQSCPVPSDFPERCSAYLEETNYCEWRFNDLWDGDELLRAACGGVWLRALQQIIDTTDDMDKSRAAVLARTRYKNREHLPEPSEVVKSTGSSKKRKRQPPVYEDSEEATSPVTDPRPNLYPKRRRSRDQQHPRGLPADRKWLLPSGRFAEDILLELAQSQADEARRLRQIPKESYAHSLIVDMDDPHVERLFGEDWPSIVSLLLPLPEVDDSLKSFMHRFVDVKTTTDLRNVLKQMIPESLPGTCSDQEQDDQDWVYMVLTSLHVLYRSHHMSAKENLETWFQMNIWSQIFDRCFQYVPMMTIARSESQSHSNFLRKSTAKPSTRDPANPNPTDPPTIAPQTTSRRSPERKVNANRYDGLITHNSIEYGAVEDSKEFKEETSTKWLSDSLKLAKVLHDQLRGLEGKVRHDREALGNLQCVGFLTAGLHCRSLYLQYGKGHVCLLRRGMKCQVPKNLSAMTDLIAVLVMVWQIRETVRSSIANLEGFLDKNTELLFEEAVKQLEPMAAAILPTCFDTDAEP